MSADDTSSIAVPELDAPWAAIWQFARTYDAYARHGGFAGAARLGNSVHDGWSRAGTLPHDLTTLQAALAFQERRFDHFGVDPHGEDARFVLALLARIRELTADTHRGPDHAPAAREPPSTVAPGVPAEQAPY